MTEIGPHLLGRLPTTPDSRDFTVAMVKDASPVELAYQRMLAARGANPAVKDWATEVMAILDPTPTPPTPPDDPTQNVNWGLTDPILDQGQTGHCGGFGGCQWGNVAPVDDHYANADGHALYYEAVSIGGFPGSEDGVESRWVAQALQARKRLATYAFAKTTDEVTDWLRTQGPVMVGTDWTDDMFDPSPTGGYVTPTAAVAGGHFWVLVGHQPEEAKEAYLAVNSWGASWGLDGFFRITVEDFAKLLAGIDYPGDAIVSPELAL